MTENWESMIFLNEDIDGPLFQEQRPRQESSFLEEFECPQRPEESQQDSFKDLKPGSKRGKQPWTLEQSSRLQRLHSEMGNKWCSIAKSFEHKTQNDVKNHFFSQLRLALRHLNKVIGKSGSFKMKPIKAGIIYKVISTCDQKYKKDSKTDPQLINLALRIKQGLFDFLEINQDKTEFAFEVTGFLRSFSLMFCRKLKGKKSKALQELQSMQDNSKEGVKYSFSISRIFDEGDGQKEEDFLDSKGKEEMNNDTLKDNESSQIMLEEINDIIARPEIFLLDPFEGIKIFCGEEQGGLTIFEEEEGYGPLNLWDKSIPYGS